MRSLWAGVPLPTLPVKAAAERTIGIQAETLVYTTYFVTDVFDHDLSRWRSRRGIGALVPFIIFPWAVARFDRFHFFHDQGLLPAARSRQVSPWELRFLRWLGKDVFVWSYGADVRTRRATERLEPPFMCSACPDPGRFCVCDDTRGDANAKTVAALATATFSMGDMVHYLPASREDLYYWPVDLTADGGRRYAPSFPAAVAEGPLRVVHAPNHRHFKGTAFLEEAVERLQAEAVPIELVLVEGVPNARALEIYRTADVVFDQCVIGFHGYFAQEAMALGKPVMCWIRDPDRSLLDPASCPIINTRPEAIAHTLRELAGDRPRLRALGEAGRAYVERYHTPERFGERLRRTYEALGVTTV